MVCGRQGRANAAVASAISRGADCCEGCLGEAVTRPNMRFVPTKTVEQQSCLMLHRARHLFIRQQTAVKIQSAPCRVRDCRPRWAQPRLTALLARRPTKVAAIAKLG